MCVGTDWLFIKNRTKDCSDVNQPKSLGRFWVTGKLELAFRFPSSTENREGTRHMWMLEYCRTSKFCHVHGKYTVESAPHTHTILYALEAREFVQYYYGSRKAPCPILATGELFLGKELEFRPQSLTFETGFCSITIWLEFSCKRRTEGTDEIILKGSLEKVEAYWRIPIPIPVTVGRLKKIIWVKMHHDSNIPEVQDKIQILKFIYQTVYIALAAAASYTRKSAM